MEPLPSTDLLAVGEVLVDLIAEEAGITLAAATSFRRVLGGSIANVAVGFAHLGGTVSVAGTVGRGPTGEFLLEELRSHGVDTKHVRRVARPPTIVFIDRGMATPDFEVVRGADRLLRPRDVPFELLDAVRAIHTSAFALSRDPASSAILAALSHVRARGGLTSLDLNFDLSVWRAGDGQDLLKRAAGSVDMVKASVDDLARLFGEHVSPESAVATLHAWGVRTVVVTLGDHGCRYSADGRSGRVDAHEVQAVDTTGAGDAFWAGVLRATLLGAGIADAAELGSMVAARKMTRVGPLGEDLDASALMAALRQAG